MVLKTRCSGGVGGFGGSCFLSGRKAAMAARESESDT